MIAEIIPEAYDAIGKQVSQPFLRRKGPHPTFPMGRYVSQPLTVQCSTLEDVRQFLRGCRGVSDEELFGKRDYWQPPEEFEKRKAGDCEDFSLWTWRQLLALGLDARVVFGRHGRYGIGHAWVMFFQDGKCFLVEPQARGLGLRLPRLSTLHYEPKFSVAWNGRDLKYYAHKDRSVHHLPWKLLISLIPEWTSIWGWYWLRVAVRLPLQLFKVRRTAAMY
jgi:transglutaminase superfamily protein